MVTLHSRYIHTWSCLTKTNFMKLISSWETASCAPIQEFPSILWDSKVHYCVHNSTPVVPFLSLINPVNTTPSYPTKIHFNVIHPPHVLVLLVVSFLPAFPPIFYMHASSSHSCYMPCPSHPPWLDHSNYTGRRVKVTKLLIMQFSPTSRHFISLWSKYSPQCPVLKYPQSTSFP
jgi:hypothetical protein